MSALPLKADIQTTGTCPPSARSRHPNQTSQSARPS